MVWNPTSGFPITVGKTMVPAVFIWACEDGAITSRNPAVDLIAGGRSTASLVVDNSAAGAVYKGLAFGTNTHGNFLFATNLAAGTVDVFNTNFKPAMLDGIVQRARNSRRLRALRHCQYRRQPLRNRRQANAQKVVAGAGLGFVDAFTTDGVRVRRFASRGVLNVPWGVARATQHFGPLSGDLLIGNLGSTAKRIDPTGELPRPCTNQAKDPSTNDRVE